MSSYFTRVNNLLNLLKIIQTKEDDFSRVEALRRMWNYANYEEYKELIVHKDLNILTTLIHIIHEYSDNFPICSNALGIIWFVSRSQKLPLVDPKLGLVPTLVQFILTNSNKKEFALKILSNCNLDSNVHSILLNEETSSYLFACRQELDRDEADRFIYQTYHCISTGMKEEETSKLVKYNIHAILMNRLLKVGSDPTQWANRGSGPEYYSLNFLTNFSALKDGAIAIQSLGKSHYFESMLTRGGIEMLKAAIILVNINSHERTLDLSSIFLYHPQILRLLILVLKVTITENKDPANYELRGTFFHFGMIRLRALTCFIKNLFHVSRKNIQYLIQETDFLSILYKFFQLYLFDGKELCIQGQIATEYGGGGGKDHLSAQYLLDSFICLVFYFQEFNGYESMSSFIDLFRTLFTSINEFLNTRNGKIIPSPVLCRCQILLTLLSEISSSSKIFENEMIEDRENSIEL